MSEIRRMVIVVVLLLCGTALMLSGIDHQVGLVVILVAAGDLGLNITDLFRKGGLGGS